MKGTQYSTSKYGFLRKSELVPTNIEMGGSIIVRTSEEALPDAVRGFGVAITGSSCYELNQMDSAQRKEFLEDIYGRNGLGLSVGRLSVAASDYSAELYSYNETAGDEAMEHFAVERDDDYIIPMIQEVLKVNPELLVYASPWSPPGWMKTGGSMCGGYMREKYIACYARYIVKFVEEYQKRGIKIDALTPQNEPEKTQRGQMPACDFHPDIEAKFVLELRKQLRESGKNPEIWMHDYDFREWKRVVWMFQEYPKLMEASGAAAFHYYAGSVEMTQGIKKEFPDLKLHFTEGGPRLYDHYDTDWCKWSMTMAKALNCGCSTFTGWNLLLDETGGPNIGPFFCGGLATLNSETHELTYSGQYRAFAHFSKFIKKGAKIYPSTVENDGSAMFVYPNLRRPVESCAARNEDGSFVLVLVNANDSKAQVQYFYGGQWWYIEMLPDSVSTIVFSVH